MFGLGGTEIIIIAIIAFLIFGANKIPAVGTGLGKGIANFKRASKGLEEIEVRPTKIEEPSAGTGSEAEPKSKTP